MQLVQKLESWAKTDPARPIFRGVAALDVSMNENRCADGASTRGMFAQVRQPLVEAHLPLAKQAAEPLQRDAGEIDVAADLQHSLAPGSS